MSVCISIAFDKTKGDNSYSYFRHHLPQFHLKFFFFFFFFCCLLWFYAFSFLSLHCFRFSKVFLFFAFHPLYQLRLVTHWQSTLFRYQPYSSPHSFPVSEHVSMFHNKCIQIQACKCLHDCIKSLIHMQPVIECFLSIYRHLNLYRYKHICWWDKRSTYSAPSMCLGWNLERCSFLHSMSWASRPGKAHPSPAETTADVLQPEGSPWSWTCICWFFW